MFKKTFPALVLGLGLVAGCESLGLGGDDSKDSSSDKTTRDDRISRDSDTAHRDRGGFEMKYPADFDHGVPSGARLVREANGSDVQYKTPHDGKLYVYDVDSKRVTWSGFMRDGERFTMDSRNGRARVENQDIMNKDLNPDHQYRMYFVEGSRDSLDSSSSSRDRYDDRNSR
jgi:hypothetical protein